MSMQPSYLLCMWPTAVTEGTDVWRNYTNYTCHCCQAWWRNKLALQLDFQTVANLASVERLRHYLRSGYMWNKIIRPPDILVGGLTFYRDSSSSSSSFRPLISELAERNSTTSGHMAGSKCDLKMHVQNLGYPLFIQIGIREPKSRLFRRFRDLTATLTAYVFGMKQDIDNRASALQTARGLLHCLRTTWTLVYKRRKVGPEFSHTLRQLCVFLHLRASHTHFRSQNSTKLCQTERGKPR